MAWKSESKKDGLEVRVKKSSSNLEPIIQSDVSQKEKNKYTPPETRGRLDGG